MTWDTWLQARGIDPEKLEPGAEIDLSSLQQHESIEAGNPTPRPVVSKAQMLFEAAWKVYGNPAYPITDDNREYKFHPTRKWRADFVFPQARVLVEIEGMQSATSDHEGRHRSFTGFMNDASKYNAAVVAGWAVYRVPSVWLYSDLKIKQVCEDIKQLIKERTVKHTVNPELKETTFTFSEEALRKLDEILETLEEYRTPEQFFASQADGDKLTFAAYQAETVKTAVYPEVGKNPYYVTLGLCGEAGEVAEKVKKVMRDKGGVFDDESKAIIAKELGDVCWYVARLADELGLSLGDIAADNLAKLADRKARDVLHGEGDKR